MIDKIKCYVKDLPFMRRRKLWLEICDAARSEKYHAQRAMEYMEQKIALIQEYDELGGKKGLKL